MAQQLARRLFSVAETRRLARRALPRPLFDFVDGAAEDEHTLRRNEAAFADISLLPRPLNGTTARDQSLNLFGARLSLPVIVGPTGLSGLLWPDGELATARAAAAAGTAFCLSHGSTCTIEDLAATGMAPRWMQVFVFRDRGLTRSFTHAGAGSGLRCAGADHRQPGAGQPRARPPQRLLDSAAVHGRPTCWGCSPRGRGSGACAASSTSASPTMSMLPRAATCGPLPAAWRACSIPRHPGPTLPGCEASGRGPLLLKGVLHPDEARRAVAEGIDGIIVSNHGGRQLDGAAATIEALPAIVGGGRGADPRAARRRRPPRRGHRPGAGPGRQGLPDRSAASVGPGRRRRGWRRRRARCLSPRARPCHGTLRLGRSGSDRRHRPCQL